MSGPNNVCAFNRMLKYRYLKDLVSSKLSILRKYEKFVAASSLDEKLRESCINNALFIACSILRYLNIENLNYCTQMLAPIIGFIVKHYVLVKMTQNILQRNASVELSKDPL